MHPPTQLLVVQAGRESSLLRCVAFQRLLPSRKFTGGGQIIVVTVEGIGVEDVGLRSPGQRDYAN